MNAYDLKIFKAGALAGAKACINEYGGKALKEDIEIRAKHIADHRVDEAMDNLAHEFLNDERGPIKKMVYLVKEVMRLDEKVGVLGCEDGKCMQNFLGDYGDEIKVA